MTASMAECDALVAEARTLYASPHKARSLCVERHWSDDGETELARYPYSRIRFVKTYNALDVLTYGKWTEVGLIAETW
jgi:hypothetical protein